MAIVLQDDWESYADGTLVKDISPWVMSGDVNGLKVLSGDIVGASSNGALAYIDALSVDQYVEWTMASTPASNAVTYFGGALHALNQNDCLSVRHINGGSYQVGYRQGSSTWVGLKTFSATPTVDDVIRLESLGGELKFYINSVLQSPSDTAIPAHMLARTNAGMWTALGSDTPLFKNTIIANTASNSISIDSFQPGLTLAVIGSTRTYTIAGDYSGSVTPTAIHARVEEIIGGATIVDWTEIDASPAAGTYSGTLDIPKSNYAVIKVRYSNDNSITATSNKIGFGITAEGGGQSNMNGIFNGTDAVTPNANTSVFDGVTTWALPDGAMTALLNNLQAEHNCCVAMIKTSVGGTDIDAHLSGGSNYAAREAALTAAGGKVNYFFWGQGETVSTGYQADLVLLYNDILTRSGQTSATLPMFIVQLGIETGTVNTATWNQVRQAQTLFADATANVYISHQTMDLPMSDVVHRTASGSLQEALRFADTYNNIINGATYSGLGVIPTSATYTGTALTITHDLNNSTSITVPAGADALYEVSDDDFSTFITVNAASSPTSNTIELTLDSTPTGTIKLRTHQGKNINQSLMPVGTVLYDSQAVMVEPIVIEMSVTSGDSSVTSTISETFSGYSEAITAGIQGSIDVTATETFDGFSESINVTAQSKQNITSIITETFGGFSEIIGVRLPASWLDKPPVTTNWTDKV